MHAPDRAQDQLAKDLERLLSQLPMIPEAVIAGVHSAGFAEDGVFQLLLDCVDGRTLVVTAAEGSPLAVRFAD